MLPMYWPKENRFRTMLREGPPPTMMYIALDSVNLIEMLGAYGIDAVIVDFEHTATTLEEASNKITAAENAGITAFVRPSHIDFAETGRLLTLGAQGVVYSMVSNEEDAEAIKRAVYYPPLGERGFAGPHGRYARWTGTVAANEDPDHKLFSSKYIEAANDELAKIFIIENQAGVENLEKILEIGKPDAVQFGASDFAVSVGFDQAKVAAAKKRIYDVARSNGVGMVLTVVPPDDQEYYPGCILYGGVEATVISDAMYARVKALRSRIDELGLRRVFNRP
jgi:4-hydroxy-2-oxoheptanedioate aldolase